MITKLYTLVAMCGECARAQISLKQNSMAGKFGGEITLADQQMDQRTAKLNSLYKYNLYPGLQCLGMRLLVHLFVFCQVHVHGAEVLSGAPAQQYH